MSFSDPQMLIVNGANVMLPRISAGQNSSTYLSSDGLMKFSVSHSYGKRTRRILRADQSKISADPFLPTQNVRLSQSFYCVSDTPPAGFSVDEQKYLALAFATFLSGNSGAGTVQWLGGEN